MDSIVEYGAQVKCRDCYTMIPVDPDTDDAPVPRRRCPECIQRAHRPRAQRRAAQRQSAGGTTTPTSASSLRTRLHSKSPPTTGTTPCCAASIGGRDNDADLCLLALHPTAFEEPTDHGHNAVLRSVNRLA